MSSFKKSAKSLKRAHRERGQPAARKHLGLLEKHKDYTLRARDYNKKKNYLKVLHEKARNRNPDEFYYRMINEKLQDGRHVIPQEEEKFTPEQLKLMKTQDLKYVEMKCHVERKKIERLGSGLHLLSDTPSNTHTIFVDTAEEVANFSPAKHFDTLPEMVSRSYNRPTSQQLNAAPSDHTPEMLEKATRKSDASYRELKQRIHRSKQLLRLAQKMKTQKNLMAKGQKWRIRGDDVTPRTYIWKKERKR
jgi:U3 small nucleolar RNA-associated protein 11